MLTGSAAHPRLAWALTEPVNITHRSTYHRPQPSRNRRIPPSPTPSIVMSPQRRTPPAHTPADPDAGLRFWLREFAAGHPR